MKIVCSTAGCTDYLLFLRLLRALAQSRSGAAPSPGRTPALRPCASLCRHRCQQRLHCAAVMHVQLQQLLHQAAVGSRPLGMRAAGVGRDGYATRLHARRRKVHSGVL